MKIAERKCQECKGILKDIRDFFGKGEYGIMTQKFKKAYGVDFPEIKGWNCMECGAVYDIDFKRQQYNIGWLPGEKDEEMQRMQQSYGT